MDIGQAINNYPEILVWLAAVFAYCYVKPASKAASRKHKNANAIFMLNLLLGWSVIGWVAALVWAYTNQPQGDAQNQVGDSVPSGGKAHLYLVEKFEILVIASALSYQLYRIVVVYQPAWYWMTLWCVLFGGIIIQNATEVFFGKTRE